MAKVFVITGPSGVGKGTLIAELLQRVPELELSVSATTREPREGEVDGRDYHFLSPRGIRAPGRGRDFLEFATYSDNRYGTLRSEVERRLGDGRSVVLEIEVQGARQVRAAIPESVQSSSRRPIPRRCASASVDRGTDSPRRSSAARVAEQELAAQDDFDHRDRQRRRRAGRRPSLDAGSCAPSWRGPVGPDPLHSPAE